MEISDPVVLGVLGSIATVLTGTIGKLYLDNKDLRTENGAIRDKYQQKIEDMIKQLTELMVTSANQTNTYTNSISTLTNNMAQFQDKILNNQNAFADKISGAISSLREVFFAGKKE